MLKVAMICYIHGKAAVNKPAKCITANPTIYIHAIQTFSQSSIYQGVQNLAVTTS